MLRIPLRTLLAIALMVGTLWTMALGADTGEDWLTQHTEAMCGPHNLERFQEDLCRNLIAQYRITLGTTFNPASCLRARVLQEWWLSLAYARGYRIWGDIVAIECGKLGQPRLHNWPAGEGSVPR